MSEDRIEILDSSLLHEHRPLVEELRQLARSLRLEFGWHYLLDLTWIISQLKTIERQRMMDAGAGMGVMQWYLAEHGATVISVDRQSRLELPRRFRERYQVDGLRQQDAPKAGPSGASVRKIKGSIRDLLDGNFDRTAQKKEAAGQVFFYNQDLKQLTDLADDSLDAVVSVSALEHNSPEDLNIVVKELMRVLKPGKPLLATLGAARDADWFHLPSKGWCYTEATLRSCFDLSISARSNYSQYDELFKSLRECNELKANLASFYKQSGDNGMPWGVWDPQYQVVGVCKVKSNA